MAEMLTMDQIRKRYDSEWVLLQDPQRDERDRVTGGTLVFHCKDRDEVWQKAIELIPPPRRIAVFYFGETADHSLINL
jgi:hypothetical protein